MDDAPATLQSDIRFLGRVLGDVIRAEDGEAVFNQIEAIRQASVAFHRDGSAETGRRLAERLGGLARALLLADAWLERGRRRALARDHLLAVRLCPAGPT